MAKKFLIINGPNLNLLGEREPEIYGTKTLGEIEVGIRKFAIEKNVEVDFFQSNFEGEIVEKIQKTRGVFDGIIINPAALSHTSFSIQDALKAVSIPAVEVHLSNIFSREKFRKNSITASACLGVISGLGWQGYIYAISALISD